MSINVFPVVPTGSHSRRASLVAEPLEGTHRKQAAEGAGSLRSPQKARSRCCNVGFVSQAWQKHSDCLPLLPDSMFANLLSPALGEELPQAQDSRQAPGGEGRSPCSGACCFRVSVPRDLSRPLPVKGQGPPERL